VKNSVSLILMIFLGIGPSIAQSPDSISNSTFLTGLMIQAGIGSYSIRDEFISREKYHGPMSSYSLSWADATPSRGSLMSIEYHAGSNLKNFNVSSSITEFGFRVGFLYRVGTLSLLSQDVQVLLGPLPELFLHFRRQNIANGGDAITRAYSVAMLLSAGIAVDLACPLTDQFLARLTVTSNAVSVGGRFINPDNTDDSFFRLLSFLDAVHLNVDFGFHYQACRRLTLAIDYRLELTRIDAWDFFMSGFDAGMVSFQFGF
jgi:hypothetical protein